jgi:penicillin G amidase
MRRLLIVAVAVASVLSIVVIAAVAYGTWMMRRSFPSYEGELAVAGLDANVTVHRDEYGIPQIYADNAEDLFTAQGYVHAQDRFWEMDFRRHVTEGRLAELFGEDQVERDTFLRTLGWRRVAERELAVLSPDTRRWLQAYADGVNAYLEEREGAELSLEYGLLGLTGVDAKPESWTPADSVSWLKAMAWDLRGNMQTEIARAQMAARLPLERIEELYPPYPYDRHQPILPGYVGAAEPVEDISAAVHAPTRTAPPAAAQPALAAAAEAISDLPTLLGTGEGIGSNSWVVSGGRTATGGALLANDPHLAPQMPSTWYQMGLHCRDVSSACPFQVAGYTFSGVPGVVIGHNDRIAWGMTNLGPDVTDLYLERLEGAGYAVPGGTRALEEREETIRVADGDDVTITVRSTRHGPLLSDASEELREVGRTAPVDGQSAGDREPGYGVALRWTALEPGRTADALFQLNRAENWDAFREAARLFDVPAQNLVYAHVDGHIGYQAPGRIPIRPTGPGRPMGRWPAAGWTDEDEWLGYIPYEELPSAYDPAEGYIVTANNAVTSPAYPNFLTDEWAYGYRSQRIVDLIEELGTGIDAADMTAIQRDTRNGNAAFLVPLLLDVQLGAWDREAQDLLRDWDYSQPPESAAAAYFNAVWKNLLSITFDDELPEPTRPNGGDRWFEVVRRLMQNPDNGWWDNVATKDVRETRDMVLQQAMVDARAEMTRLQGKDPREWTWGWVHELEVQNGSFGASGIGPIEALFNRGPLRLGGGPSTVDAVGWNAAAGYDVNWVPSMRMVVDLSDLDASRWINLTGASGHAFHRHYFDQAALWSSGRTTQWPWTPEAVEDAAEHTLTLTP